MAFIYEFWLVIQLAAPYLLIGFLIGGIIHTFVAAEQIVSLVGKRDWKSVLMASICGIPLPLCSCSVLPMAATLRKKGASRGGTTSFLISTPETGVDSIALTYGLMDLTMTILRPLAAFVTALAAGITVNRWGERGNDEQENSSSEEMTCCGCEDEPVADSTRKQVWWRETFRYAFVDLIDDLAYWLVLGFILSAIISAWIPDWIFSGWVGQGFTSLLIMLAVSMPMYICATASTPVAAMMIAKGLSPGAALVFLLAGPATNISSIPLLTKVLGRRSTLLYLVAIIVISILIGASLNWYCQYFQISLDMNVGEAQTEELGWINTLSGILLLVLLIKGMWKSPVPAEWRSAGNAIASFSGIKPTQNKMLFLLVLILFYVMIQSCFFVVASGEIGIIQRFGKPVSTNLPPGLYFHLPPPISSDLKVKVEKVQTLELSLNKSVQNENQNLNAIDTSLYLTGDENMLDISAVARYKIKQAADYIFEVENPEQIIHSAMQTALTHTLALMKIDTAYTTARREIESKAAAHARELLEVAMPGVIDLLSIQLLRVHAPVEVHHAFRDVASAEEDREKQKNEALVEKEKQIHLARGEAAQMLENAQAKKTSRILNAKGESASFMQLAECNMKWPEETRMRLWYEAIDDSFLHISKTIVPGATRWTDFDLWLMESDFFSFNEK